MFWLKCQQRLRKLFSICIRQLNFIFSSLFNASLSQNICTPSTLVTHTWWCHALSVAMAVVMATAAKALEMKAIHRCKSRVNIDSTANANYALRSACKQQLLLHFQLSHTPPHFVHHLGSMFCTVKKCKKNTPLVAWRSHASWLLADLSLPLAQHGDFSPGFLSLRHDISSEGVYSHWPAVLSALPPVHTRCTLARWHHRDRCHRSLLWWQDVSVSQCVLQKDVIWQKHLLALKNDLDLQYVSVKTMNAF